MICVKMCDKVCVMVADLGGGGGEMVMKMKVNMGKIGFFSLYIYLSLIFEILNGV